MRRFVWRAFQKRLGQLWVRLRVRASVFVSRTGGEMRQDPQCFLSLHLLFIVVASASRSVLGPPWGLILDREQ